MKAASIKVEMNQFLNIIEAKARQSILKLDFKIKQVIIPMYIYFASANRPIAPTSLHSKNVVRKETGQEDCCTACCEGCCQTCGQCFMQTFYSPW